MSPQLGIQRGEDPLGEQTTWGRSLTRPFKHLRPSLNKVQRADWMADCDLEAGSIRNKGSKWSLYIMAFQTLGVVYGDLGTSPLYVFAGIFSENLEATPENMLGTLSLIIWTISLVAFVKYALIVLRADDNGQGGSLALFSQLRRQANLTSPESSHPSSVHLDTHGHTTPRPPTDWRQRFLATSGARILLRIMVVMAVGLILGDGVLTPAVTVVSAFEGLTVAAEGVTRGTIVGVSCAVVGGLFVLQKAGPSKLGSMFAPIVATYFAFNFGTGIYNIFKYEPTIFKAFSPHYFFKFFIRNGIDGWRALAGVVLCITGTEAMFADLQHFNQRSIFLGFVCICYPSVVTMYLGQAAYLTHFPEKVSETFWASLPGGKPLFWPMFIVVTLTSMVASQALISATFSIVSQAIKQGFFPKFRIIHTSKTHTGQIYVPVVNWVLMVLTLVAILAFQTSARISTAYGLAVACDMFITTIFMTLIILCVWRKHIILPILFFAVYLFIEGTLLSASLLKVPTGGWLTLTMAAIYVYIMLLWLWGSNKKKQSFHSTQQSMTQFLLLRNDTHPQPTKDAGFVPSVAKLNAALQKLPGVSLYYSSSIQGVPHVLTQTVRLTPHLAQVCVFMTIRRVPLPEVLPMERLLVQQLSAGFFHVIVRYGYTEQIAQSDSFVQEVMRHIQSLMYRSLRHRLIQDIILAPLASKCKLSKATTAVVDSVIGDIYGEGHSDLKLTKRNLASKNLELSTRSLAGHDSRSLARGQRPSILDDLGNMRLPSTAGDVGSTAASNGVNGSSREAAALIYHPSSHLTWPRGMKDQQRKTTPADAAAEDFDTSSFDDGVGDIDSPIPHTSALAAVARQVALRDGGNRREGVAMVTAPEAFEAEMAAWANEVKDGLVRQSASSIVAVESLRRLAAELAHTANATAEGTRGYVIGRSHATPMSPRGWSSLPRQFFLEMPFSFIQKNVESNAQAAFGLPEEKLLEVGLKYHL